MEAPKDCRLITWKEWEFKPTPLTWLFYARDFDERGYPVGEDYNRDGIYFLLDRNKDVVYIGQSNNMLTRCRNHRGISSKKRQAFSHIAILHLDKLDISLFKTRSEALNFYERLFIKHHKPILNRQIHKPVL